jgi:hypothetical protein
MQPPPVVERRTSVDVHAFIQQVQKQNLHGFVTQPATSLSPTSSNVLSPTTSSGCLLSGTTSSGSLLYATRSKDVPVPSKPAIIIPTAAAAAAISNATAAATIVTPLPSTSSTSNINTGASTSPTQQPTPSVAPPPSNPFGLSASELHRYLPAPTEPCDNIVVIPSVVVHTIQHALPALSTNNNSARRSSIPSQPSQAQQQSSPPSPLQSQSPSTDKGHTAEIRTVSAQLAKEKSSFSKTTKSLEELSSSGRSLLSASFDLNSRGSANRSYMKLPPIHTLFAQLGQQRSEPDLNSLANLVVNMTD